MAPFEHTLTGFGDFWEKRRVTFVERPFRLPMCSFCSALPSQPSVLACRHVTCSSCERQLRASGQCYLDGQPFSVLAGRHLEVKLCELDDLKAHCLNDTCGFTGTLREVKSHLQECTEEAVKCTNCDATVFRKELMVHYQGCLAAAAALQVLQQSVDVEELTLIKQNVKDFGELESAASCDAKVPDDGSSLFRLSMLDPILPKTDNANRLQGHPTVMSPPRAVGPFRAARKAGVFVSICYFEDIQRTLQALEDKSTSFKATDVVMAGYKVKMICKFTKDSSGYISFSFGVRLEDGEWNNIVEWPFTMNASVVLTHPSNARKDLRAVIRMDSHEVTKKPWPYQPNKTGFSEKFSLEMVEREGFVYEGNLIATLEFE
ncbi:hypothetical protein MRX96_058470 [Rhipicephalus microplus]